LQTIFWPLQLHTLENGTIALDVHWDSDCFETEQHGKVPYLDASASYQPELGRISINLINRHRTEALPVTVENQHGNLKSDGTLFEITGEDPQVINDFDEENVKLVKRELEVPSNPFTVTLPPHSISMVQVYLG
jgi:alpha-N-arabinofuranosidase